MPRLHPLLKLPRKQTPSLKLLKISWLSWLRTTVEMKGDKTTWRAMLPMVMLFPRMSSGRDTRMPESLPLELPSAMEMATLDPNFETRCVSETSQSPRRKPHLLPAKSLLFANFAKKWRTSARSREPKSPVSALQPLSSRPSAVIRRKGRQKDAHEKVRARGSVEED